MPKVFKIACLQTRPLPTFSEALNEAIGLAEEAVKQGERSMSTRMQVSHEQTRSFKHACWVGAEVQVRRETLVPMQCMRHCFSSILNTTWLCRGATVMLLKNRIAFGRHDARLHVFIVDV